MGVHGFRRHHRCGRPFHWRLILLLVCWSLSSHLTRASTVLKLPKKNSDTDDNAKNPLKIKDETERKKKYFSLFTVVTFPNQQCTTKSDATMFGQCLTSSECASTGGAVDGGCASGFGVCCLFIVSACGSTITQNCTYIQNPSYSSAWGEVSTSCSYTINAVDSGICQLRLDYDDVETAAATLGACSPAANDDITVTSPSGRSPPVVCGTLTGDHMYVETAQMNTAATIAIRAGSATATRRWKIKVSQIECNAEWKAPEDCVQYYTGTAGTLSSFNFPNFLQEQQYSSCFRQEMGYCQIQYRESSITTPDPFKLSSSALSQKSSCNSRLVRIKTDVATAIATHNRDTYCGNVLSQGQGTSVPNPVTGSVAPFNIEVLSDASNTQADITGFNLVYHQVPC